MSLQDFDYELSPNLIAQRPCDHREDSRLLIHSGDGGIRHSFIKDLPKEIPKESLIIVNDSRVIASRLIGRLATGARIEVFLLEPRPGTNISQTSCQWKAIGKPMRKLHLGTEIHFPPFPGSRIPLIGKVTDSPDRTHTPPTMAIEFPLNLDSFHTWLEIAGMTPLPPYIHRGEGSGDDAKDQIEFDRARYQTIFANEKGSVAAPTAGLHYTAELIERLKSERQVDFASVTLHVGAGTFLPVKDNDIALHHMHTERYKVSTDCLNRIFAAQDERRSIVVVGTTTFRCLESFWMAAGRDREQALQIADKWLGTDLFVWPKSPEETFSPWCASALQTNFHQPMSTLLMLVSALAGVETIRDIYKVAIAKNYRFFSYGDSMLLWLKPTAL